MSNVKIVIVPGNGDGDVERSNWYGWLRNKLRQVKQSKSVACLCSKFVTVKKMKS